MSSYQTRTNQGGSVVTFLIVGGILVAVVVGGIYAVQRRSQETPSPSPVVSTSPSASPSPAGTSVPNPTTNPGSQSTQPPASVPQGSTIPSTGPSDDFISVVAFAVLSGLLVAYVRSRRSRLRLLEK